MHFFTQEQWFEIFRFALYPLFVWIIKGMVARAVHEVREAIDSRADAVAIRRAAEMREQVSNQISQIQSRMTEHETFVRDRLQQLQDSINLLARSAN
jgi:hypothetical protein